MTSKKWQQVRKLFEEALDRQPDQRAAFLDQACGSDTSLRKEVESLIASHEEADDFLEVPPLRAVAELLADEKKQLEKGHQVGPYRVLSSIGKGGMGEVYLARDTRLGRKIAIKMLPSAYTFDDQRVGRFEQEARAASSLNHPNILTIFDIGQSQKAHFIAMEYVEGLTLREILNSGPMRVGEALDVTIQIASALSAAHQAGIIHRDIKPENIMLRPDGYVKVLDFGLAKLSERSSFYDESSFDLMQVDTTPGLVMGTPNYMSPEQARGQQVDARTDIFSLGVVLYELLVGETPFKGETPTDTIALILRGNPRPLADAAPNLPRELQLIIDRSLSKTTEARYRSVTEMLDDLRSVKDDLDIQAKLKRHAPTSSDGAGRIVLKTTESRELQTARTEPVSTVSSAEYLISQIKMHRRAALVVILLIVIAVAIITYTVRLERSIDSVAVLPFANLSEDAETEYLSDGLADSIINRLSQLSTLKVMSLNSVSRYKGQQIDSKSVGRELGVQAVLVGRMMQRGDDISIITELVNVDDNSRIWGHQYNRKLSDILALQDEIAKEISDNLRLKLSGEDKRRLAKSYTENTDAYRLYLKGRYYWNMRTDEGLSRGVEYFNQAIEKDPFYALAYAGLADCYGLMSNYGNLPPMESMSRARAYAQKALEIDNTLAEARASLGLVKKEYDWDFAGAEREFARAIELNANYATAHQWRAENLIILKRTDEAIEDMMLARELDPFSTIISSEVGWAFYHARRYDEAIEQLNKTAAMSPNFARTYFFLGRVYEQKRMYAEAIAATEKAISLSGGYNALFKASLAHIYAMAGKRSQANRELDELKQRSNREYISPFAIALVYAGLGESDQAFEWMEQAYRTHDTILVNYIRDPQLDTLRSDSRFYEMLKQFGLEP